ncbi:MAG: hypothetical protein G01um1014107_224 [Parcubacteria group bacterium Gr01-1014_107]|nr:MAG: hypothetical protein G01um1014107_224 [Parcubacteria group bacterium Gr01-1014_107]
MRRAFTLTEILLVVVVLGILAAIVIPQLMKESSSTPEKSAEEVGQTLVEALCSGWENAEPGDLVVFTDSGRVYVVVSVLSYGLRLHSGLPGEEARNYKFRATIQGHSHSPGFISQRDLARYGEINQRFTRQAAGLSPEKTSKSSNSTSVAPDG